VFWVCTANYLEQIPVELRDRILMINVPGYNEQEQVEILHNYLIPKYRLQWSMDIDLPQELNEFFVTKHLTGVRDMEHNLQRVCKSIMLDTALGEPVGFTEDYLSKVLNKKLTTNRKPIGFMR
jgi:ATP-dependent Lon protease